MTREEENARTPSRVLVVTGGACGIGRGICRLFASRGCRVTIADRDAPSGRELEKEIASAGGEALFCRSDVRVEADIQHLMDTVIREWGRLDVLCNNAGIELSAPAQEFPTERADAIIETNYRAVFLCSRYAHPHLKTHRGCIVNISSVQGFANEPRSAVYAGTKAGVLGLTRGLAIDFAAEGIRVNAVCPGAILTGMTRPSFSGQLDLESAIAAMEQSIPLGRIGQPEDVAAAVWFLASADAAYITGSSVTVDGGLLARLAL